MKLFSKKKKSNLATKEMLIDKIGKRIYFGPFSGIKIPSVLSNMLTVSEILGLYESALHPIFSKLLNNNIENIILVGGNNGYYAAGINYILSPKKISIFESEIKFHNVINSWFIENKMSNYLLLGEANGNEFNKINTKIDFIFMDCEGFEIELLNPELFLWQQKTEILLELHPFYVENLISELVKRFKKTHVVELIYDDFNEDTKIKTILSGLDLNIKYNKHPTHRWIQEKGQKVYTSGVFMYLKQR